MPEIWAQDGVITSAKAIPFSPKEAQDLPTHVEKCAERYSTLHYMQTRLLLEFQAVKRMNWLYAVVMFPLAVSAVVLLWEIYRTISKSGIPFIQ